MAAGSRNDTVDICRFLLCNGASVHAESSLGWTPLHLAVDLGHLEKCRMLLQAGAEHLGKTIAGQSFLHICVYPGRRPIADLFLAHGTPATIRDVYGDTPLHLACSTTWEEHALHFTQFFLDHNADLFALNKRNKSPFRVAGQNKLETVQALLWKAMVQVAEKVRHLHIA